MNGRLDRLDDCWRSGYRTFEREGTKARNPFVAKSEAWFAWNEGYETARHEYEDLPPNDNCCRLEKIEGDLS